MIHAVQNIPIRIFGKVSQSRNFAWSKVDFAKTKTHSIIKQSISCSSNYNNNIYIRSFITFMGSDMSKSALDDPSSFPTVDTKHFVLGNPIKFEEADSKILVPKGLEYSVFATGCFWGSEKRIWRMPGVYSTAVGYTAGDKDYPTYEQVCTGSTGHAEAVLVVWDPSKVSYADLLRMHFESHNPTSGNGQGNDRGTQYRSGIYFTNEAQRVLAKAAFNAYQAGLRENGYDKKITTELAPLTKFYYAEAYHQQYLARPGSRPYCSAEPLGVSMPDFSTWGSKVVESLPADQAIIVGPPKLPEKFWDKHAPKPYCSITKEKDSQIELSAL